MSSNPEAETIQINLSNLDKLKFNSEGLIPAIAQDIKIGEVLMMAWMNMDSLKATITTGAIEPGGAGCARHPARQCLHQEY